jgi:hypothetical protein
MIITKGADLLYLTVNKFVFRPKIVATAPFFNRPLGILV